MTDPMTRWRRLGILGACFFLGNLCWITYSSVKGRPPVAADAQDVDVSIPNKDLSPEDVVSMQVESMRDSVTRPDRLKVCYSLASPENREVTGPYSNFAKMIKLQPYDRLANCRDWQLGSAAIENGYAAVLVSTISNEGELTAFRFLMHLHDAAPYSGCWLTEAVQLVGQVSTSEDIDNPGAKEPLLD